jgi:hypothetical protein
MAASDADARGAWSILLQMDGETVWRPDPESNRGARICNPLRHHSAIGPKRGRELLRFARKVNPKLRHPCLMLDIVQNRRIVAQKTQSAQIRRNPSWRNAQGGLEATKSRP